MNNYTGSIDTDMAIGSILSNFDTSWVMNTIHDSLNMKFRPFGEPMPNFVDILNRQFDSVIDAGPDYKEKINETKVDTYKEIITAICDYYGLVFTEPFEEINPVELYGIAHTMYDIFISRFTDYMIHFFVTYINIRHSNNCTCIHIYFKSIPFGYISELCAHAHFDVHCVFSGTSTD